MCMQIIELFKYIMNSCLILVYSCTMCYFILITENKFHLFSTRYLKFDMVILSLYKEHCSLFRTVGFQLTKCIFWDNIVSKHREYYLRWITLPTIHLSYTYSLIFATCVLWSSSSIGVLYWYLSGISEYCSMLNIAQYIVCSMTEIAAQNAKVSK